MTLHVRLLNSADDPAYERLVLAGPERTLYYSGAYRRFLQTILVRATPHYLGVWDGETLVGAMPAFSQAGRTRGPVLNSLPFYGSNGAAILDPSWPRPEEARRALLAGFAQLATDLDVVSSTVISNPLDEGRDVYESAIPHDCQDSRIGQVTPLAFAPRDPAANIAEALMAGFHQKTRNAIRKAAKSAILVRHSAEEQELRRLAELHRENLSAMGGMAKPPEVFAAIRSTFTYDRDYRVYVAERNGQLSAMLLVFFYNRTAEYFTPATVDAEREFQPMSLLILRAMEEAVRRDCRWWNWGGTWASQAGVYHFKSRWGTEDRTYRYFIRIRDQRLRSCRPAELLDESPFFYTVPFQLLNRTGATD